MKLLSKFSLVGAFMLTLAGCAPGFQEFKSYQDPVGSSKKMSCVNKAKTARDACSAKARASYNNCMVEQTRIARLQFDAVQRDHLIELRSYESCVRNVNRSHEYENDRYYDCKREARLNDRYVNEICGMAPGSINSYPEECGSKPRAPKLDDYIDKRACGSKTGSCESIFDSSYEQCGGVITKEERCVAFCD